MQVQLHTHAPKVKLQMRQKKKKKVCVPKCVLVCVTVHWVRFGSGHTVALVSFLVFCCLLRALSRFLFFVYIMHTLCFGYILLLLLFLRLLMCL